jgi:hypothetical protein
MEKTKNYEMFKKHDANCELNETNLAKLEKSVKQRNLLEFRPILVNKSMEVIDGQHRLEVAKRLKMEIYYEVKEDANEEDMYLLNTNQRIWKAQQYLHYFVKVGNLNYIKFDNFLSYHKITIKNGLILLNFDVSGNSTNGIYAKFKKGEFKFPDESAMYEVNEINDYLEKVQAIIRKGGGQTVYLKAAKFRMALNQFISSKLVDRAAFLRKLEFQIHHFHPCVSTMQYKELFLQVYNWRNSAPLPISSLSFEEEKN